MKRDIEEGFDTWDHIFDRICLGIGLMAVGATIGVVLVVVGMAS